MSIAAGHRDRPPGVALGRAGVVAEGLDDHAHLAAGVGDRLAGVARLEPGEVLELLLERVGEPVEQRGAVAGRDRAPGRERPAWRARPPRRSPRCPPAGPPPSPPRWRARGPRIIARGRLSSRARASSTSEPITRLRSSSSGCHSTPTANELLRAARSPRPRRRRRGRVTTTPSPSSSTPLVVRRLHLGRARRPPRARRASRARARTPWSANTPGVCRCSSRPRCWFSVPPWITFSISIRGRSPAPACRARAPACRARSRSGRARARCSFVSGCGFAP